MRINVLNINVHVHHFHNTDRFRYSFIRAYISLLGPSRAPFIRSFLDIASPKSVRECKHRAILLLQ